MVVFYVLWVVFYNFILFVIVRIIGGFSKGNVSIFIAVIVDIFFSEKRGKGMVRCYKYFIFLNIYVVFLKLLEFVCVVD